MSASQAPEMGAEAENLQAITTAYLDSFAARDLEGCLRYFADDAVLQFHVSTFRNKKGIEQWHKDRFSADLRLVRIDDMQTEGDTVRVEGVVTSKRLRAWLVNEIEGLVTFQFEQGLMKHVKFSWNQ
jgi:ketosteroid isomerase-like protein